MVFVDGAAVNKKGRLAEMSRERKISLERNTAETKISLSIDLDGTGKYQVDTGCGFLNHMLSRKNRWKEMGEACIQRSQEFSLDAVEKKMREIYGRFAEME